MSLFLPVVSSLRSSFLRPVESGTPLPARLPSEQFISRSDLRVYQHVVSANCNAEQWLALRSFVENEEGRVVSFWPRGRELNLDKIVFSSYLTAAKYCGLTSTELHHIHGPAITQHHICYMVGGAVTRTNNEISPSVITVYYSWPGYNRLTTVNINVDDNGVCDDENDNDKAAAENESENDNDSAVAESESENDNDRAVAENENNNDNNRVPVEKENEGENQNLVTTLVFNEEKKISRKNYDKHLFDVSNVNIHDPYLIWACVVATWNRTHTDGVGRVSFRFPVTFSGASFDWQKLHEKVMCAARRNS